NDRSARAARGLPVEAVFRSHAHQCMNETEVLLRDGLDAIGAIFPECIRNAIELPLLCEPAIEPHQSGDSAHGKVRSTRSPCTAEFGQTRETGSLSVRDGIGHLDPGVGRQIGFIAGYTEAKSARYAAPAQHCVCSQGARKTKRINPGLCACFFYGPCHPSCL